MSNFSSTRLYKAFLEPNPKVIHITESMEDTDLFYSVGHSSIVLESTPEALIEFIRQNYEVVYVLAIRTLSVLKEYANLFETLGVQYYALLPKDETGWEQIDFQPDGKRLRCCVAESPWLKQHKRLLISTIWTKGRTPATPSFVLTKLHTLSS